MKGRTDPRFRRQDSQDLPPNSFDHQSAETYNRSPSRSRSRSPAVGRQGKYVQRSAPQRVEPVKRTEQSYSTSGSSDDSPSGSSSSSEGAQRPAAKAPRKNAPAATRKKEAASSNKRERELVARIHSLEDELTIEKGARDELAAKSSFLTEKVRSVAERSKARGSMLVRLLGAARKVEEAKAQLEASKLQLADAELELRRITAEVTTAVAEESAPGGPPSAREREIVDGETRGLPSARSAPHEVGDGLGYSGNGQPSAPTSAIGTAPATAMAVDTSDAREDSSGPLGPGGWQEVQDPNQAGQGNRFKPFKFSIKL